MDIQLLVNLAGSRGGPSGGTTPGRPGDFAADLARAADARQAPRDAQAAMPTGRPVGDDALTELAEALPRGEGFDALRQALRHGDHEAIEASGPAVGQAIANGPAGEGLDLERLAAALGGAGSGERPDAGAARPGGDAEEWSALHERLAMIEQAGRFAVAAIGPTDSTSSPLAQARVNETEASHRPLAAMLETRGEAASRQAEISRGHRGVALAATQPALATETPLDGGGRAVEPPMEGQAGLRGDAPRPVGFELPAQAAGPSGATGGTTTPQASLPAPVTSPAWPQQLGQQLVRMSQGGGEQRVELQLHPAELGPLSVTLKLGDQGAQAQFLSAHAPVRQALEQAIPQLREALAEQGIQLAETSVGEQRAGQGGGDGLPDGDARGTGLAGHNEAEPGDAPAVAAAEPGTRELPLDGRVDLYA